MSLVFGYFTYTIEKKDTLPLYNVCLSWGIQVVKQREDDGGLHIRISVFEASAFEAVLKENGISYTRGAMKGILGRLKSLWRHPGVLVGTCLSLLLYIWLGGMVWEVSIQSSQDIDEDLVLAHLEECGLAEGVRLSAIDPDAVTAAYLRADPSIAFMALHKKGVTVEVELIVKDEGETQENTAPLCNIVATHDALITDMTVYSGKAVVKVGDTVAKGDLLVSGVISDIGGTRLVGARGDVMGILTEEGQIEIPVSVEQRQVERGQLRGVDISFFGIHASFGISDEALVAKRQIYLFGRIRLPISLTYYHERKEDVRVVTYSQEMAQRMAEARAEQLAQQAVGEGHLLSYNTSFGGDGKTFVLRYTIEYEGNIAKALAFATDN